MPVQVWLAVSAVALALGMVVVLLVVRRPVGLRERLVVTTSPVRAVRSSEEAGPVAERLLARYDTAGRLAQALETAGITRTAPQVLTVTVGAGVAGLVLGSLLAGPVLGVLLAVAAPLVCRVWISITRDRRRRAFAEQLDDALQLLASSLRAGHSLLRAVDAVSRDTQAPMADEFTRVVNEVRVGRDVGLALEEVADRTGSEDFRWVVQAIGVHREVGGNLAEVLDRVGGTIRERSQLFRQARALSAEGRTSGLVLLAMPFVVVGLIAVTTPAYLAPLFHTGVGVVLLLAAVALMGVGALWLRSIVKVRF